MTVTLLLALAMQFASLVLLRMLLGKNAWLRRPGTLLVMASVVYDGLTQVALAFPSVGQWDSFRQGIAPQYEGEAALLLSAAMLAWSLGFVLTGGGRQPQARVSDVAWCARVLDWRLLAVACVPLAVFTFEGRGYDGIEGRAPGVLASPSIPATFFIITVTLTAAAFLLRHGSRWLVPVLAAQSAVLAAAGERTPVIAAAAALAITCSRAGRQGSHRQAVTILALTVLGVLAITGARAAHTRSLFEQDTGATARITGLAEAMTEPVPPQADTPGLLAQAATRLDGTSFTAGILQARALGYQNLDPVGVPDSALEAVPKALWPSKPETTDALDPYQAEIAGFGLADVNYLAGVPGMYAGYLSPAWLVVFLGFLGAAWGLAERWMLARVTPARLVMLAGSVLAALSYEGGIPTLLVSLRAAAAVAALAWLAGRIRSRHLTWQMINANPEAPPPPAFDPTPTSSAPGCGSPKATPA